ncbi:MAG: hypothetical protein LBQ00_08960 [Syntrophobacterales bacterium]|jgi:hypothetical protein|nr:hypothetical protein [Syntrophobacterales bacterium]
MGRFYIDKKYFARKQSGNWVSFETSPELKRTKSDIYGKCVPCMTNLYEQLKEGKTKIELGPAHQCWKVVVPLRGMEECIQFLSEFERDFLEDLDVKGRFGSTSDPARDTKVIVCGAESETKQDRLFVRLKACASYINLETQVFYHRGCAELYHELFFGDWRKWNETESVKNQAMVGVVLEKIRKALFWVNGGRP